MIEYSKITELANKIRDYERDGKPLYLNLYYTNHNNPNLEDAIKVADRISGEVEFQNRLDDMIQRYKPYSIIAREYSNKSPGVKDEKFKHETIIKIQEPASGYLMQPEVSITPKPKYTPDNKASGLNEMLDHYGGLEGFRQSIRSDVAKEYQLLNEQEQKKKLIEENVLLKKEKEDLQDENDKLYNANEELAEQVQALQKYIPDNFKIGNVSVTKMLGSILGTAAEAIAKNVVTKRPEKVKEILGETAFEQLSGLLGDEPEETGEIDEDQIQQPVQELQSIETNPDQEDKHAQVANAIHDLNKKISSPRLGKIQMIYYFFLNEDETINDEKLNLLIKFINKKKPEENEQV